MKTYRTARAAGWFATATIVGAALLTPAATLATPGSDHKVTICHGTSSDTNPYVTESVDVASSGYLQGGHNDHTGPIWDATLKAQHLVWGDIIPPYTSGAFGFDGYNWNDRGQAILGADCTIPAPTTAPTEAPTTAPQGAVLGETGVPQLTPPPTDTIATRSTPADGGWRMLLLLAAAILATLLVVTPATARRRR